MMIEHSEVVGKIKALMNEEYAGGTDYKMGVGVGLSKAVDAINTIVTDAVKAGMNPPQ